MKKFVPAFGLIAAALVLALVAEQAHARGGGGGRGGARGGARAGGPSSFRQGGGDFGRASNFSGSNKLSQSGSAKSNAQNKASQAKNNYSGKNAPFSPAWYANHPRAWQATHPYAGAWAVAGFGTAAAWLGITGAAATDDTATVYTSDDGDDSDDDNADDDSASQLAEQGAGETPDADQFLSLGVFSLSPQNHQDATALVNLAVSKSGVVRGSYYDLLSEQEQAVQGAVDKKTQRVAFTIGNKGTIVFETLLTNLTSDSGSITLRYNDGKTSQWTLERQNQPEASR